MGSGDMHGQRGVSHLVGAVLLIGLTMAAAVLILLAGGGTLGDVNEQNSAEVAGQTFQQTDEAFQEFARQDRNRSQTVELPSSMEGDVEVHDSSWKLTLNENSDCTSGYRRMGEMRYTGEEQTVGYEGGGIWEMTESGATMNSPPEMTYRDGSLSVRFPNITGDVTTSDRIALSSNASRQKIQNRNLSKALYTNLSYDGSGAYDIECAPTEVTNATLRIHNSEYASAWDRYFRTNYDKPRVTVVSSKPVSPGDEVVVEFELGDVSDPEYNVTRYNVTRDGTDPGDPMEVHVNVTNEGGLSGDQTVDFEFRGPSGSPVAPPQSTTMDLASNETVSHVFTVSGSDVNSLSNGDYEIYIDTGNDTVTKPVRLRSGDWETELLIDSADAPQNASVDTVEAVDVTLRNDNGMTVIRDVEFRVDGTLVETRKVTVHPGTQSESFELPTQSADRVTWEVDTGDVTASDDFAVGSNPYFSVNETSGPDSVSAHSSYDLDVKIRNLGHLQGDMETEVVVERNRSTGWGEVDRKPFSQTIGGDVYPNNEDSFTYSNSFSREGKYRYTVKTNNETTSGEFTVGPPENPTLLVRSVEIRDNPTAFDRYAWFNVTVKNIGPERALQDVEVETESGETIAGEYVSVAPGETKTIRQQARVTESRFDEGPNSLYVSTANATVSETLRVDDSDNVDDGDDGIVIRENVKAEITVPGTEYERGDYYRENYIKQQPTNMWLQVEDNTSTERVDLWSDRYDGDLNHPEAEVAMLEDPAAYNITRTFEANTELAIFGQSLRCNRWGYDRDEYEVVYDGLWRGEDATGVGCMNTGADILTISEEQNSENVVILGDGDTVPSYGAAHFFQRDLQDMLGHRIDDEGELSLASGERVFLYELSQWNADPENAAGSGDPDYNDAVALFRVVDVERSTDEPAHFEIKDVDAPAHVPRGEPAEVAVTVTNTGGTKGNTSVFFDMEEQETIEGQTSTLEPGETDTVVIDVPTDVEPKRYEYSVLLGDNPEESHYGTIRIGPGGGFDITSLSAPQVNETHESPQATVVVTNTGNETETQSVHLLNTTDASYEVTDSRSLTLESDESREFTLDLPKSSDGGELNYQLETNDATTPRQYIYYGEVNINIENVEIAGSTYHDSSGLIEERNADTMSFKLENTGDVGGERDVTLRVEDADGNVVYDETRSDAEFGDGRQYSPRPKFDEFPVDLDEGYYDYELTVDGPTGVESTWQGELFVNQEATADSGKNSSSPISVDSNEVVISG